MKGLHGELFGVLGAPSPRADPALLAGLGAGWCTLYNERGTTTYSAALARTPVHHPQASTLQQGRVATLVLVVHLFRCIALQNQKCSWTRFAAGPGGPETWHCLGRKLRAFLQIVAPCFPMVAPLFTWLKGHRYLAQSAAFSIFKHW